MFFFQFTLLVFSTAALISAVVISLCRNGEKLPKWEKLPRARYPGLVLAAIVIFWCIPNLRPILEPTSSLQKLLIPFAFGAIFLCYMYLDYLFARAFGAFLILVAHHFLKESFGVHVYPVSAFFAAALMLLGIGGILICAKPYWFRDWIRMLFRKPPVRLASSVFLALLALSGFAVSIAAFKL